MRLWSKSPGGQLHPVEILLPKRSIEMQTVERVISASLRTRERTHPLGSISRVHQPPSHQHGFTKDATAPKGHPTTSGPRAHKSHVGVQN